MFWNEVSLMNSKLTHEMLSVIVYIFDNKPQLIRSESPFHYKIFENGQLLFYGGNKTLRNRKIVIIKTFSST